MESTNACLIAESSELTSEAESEHVKLQQEYRKEKDHTICQKKTVTRLRITVQSLTTSIEPLSSDKYILRESWNVAEFMRDEGKARKTMLATQKIKRIQQLADVQKHVATIRESLPEY